LRNAKPAKKIIRDDPIINKVSEARPPAPVEGTPGVVSVGVVSIVVVVDVSIILN
jgi:hypothetical protein